MASFFSRFTLSRKTSLNNSAPSPKKQSASPRSRGNLANFIAGINGYSPAGKENEINCAEAANYPFYDPKLHGPSNSPSPSKRRSWSSLRGKMPLSPSKRNALHDLADSVRSKTKFFYKEKEQRPSTPPLMQDALPMASTPRSVKSKKSVRFRSSNTLCDSRDTSPIKIPIEKPCLPEVDVSSNLFLDSTMELVPKTGRPTETPILAAIDEMDSALSEERVIMSPLEDDEVLPPLPTPMPGTNLPLEDPFNDTEAVTEEIERAASAMAYLLDCGKGSEVTDVDEQKDSDLIADIKRPASAMKVTIEHEYLRRPKYDVETQHFDNGYASEAHTPSTAEILLESENGKNASENSQVADENLSSTTQSIISDGPQELSIVDNDYASDDEGGTSLGEDPADNVEGGKDIESRRQQHPSTEVDATFITAYSRASSRSYTEGGDCVLSLGMMRSASGANGDSDPENRYYQQYLGVDDAHASVPDNESHYLPEPIKRTVLQYSTPLRRSPARTGLHMQRRPSSPLQLRSNVSSQSPARKSPAFKCSEFSDDKLISELEYSWHSREAGKTPSPASIPLPATVSKNAAL